MMPFTLNEDWNLIIRTIIPVISQTDIAGTSWLGLCPDNRITGGRTHAAHTRKVNNRLATALRMAAQSLHRSKSALGDWFRRIRAKLGTKAAVTAAAHKLARVLHAMIKHRSPYDPGRIDQSGDPLDPRVVAFG